MAAQRSQSCRVELRRGSGGNTNMRRELSRISNGSHNSIALSDVVEPLEFEEYLTQMGDAIDRDPLRDVVLFPGDDIEVGVVSRKTRTIGPIVPDEKDSELEPWVRCCVESFTNNWLVINRRYQHFSSALGVRDRNLERSLLVRNTPRQEFEIDMDWTLGCGNADNASVITEEGDTASESNAVTDVDDASSIADTASVSSRDTPRGSWASSVPDLRASASDPLLEGLVAGDPPLVPSHAGGPPNLLALYSPPPDDEAVDSRSAAGIPTEVMPHRLLVKCLHFKVEPDFEPLFLSMALYDAKEKRKISENFYLDLNSDLMKRMLQNHVPYADMSTLARSCIFNISSHSAQDIFLVIRVEKVLQGDIAESADPYLKEDRKAKDSLRVQAQIVCERLGRYRQPLGWTAIYLQNVVQGTTSLEKDASLATTSGSTIGRRSSLERGTKLDSFRKIRETQVSEPVLTAGTNRTLDNFRTLTVVVNHLFRQEMDKVKDEDLYKFLQEFKRPTGSALSKRLKNIPVTLRLEISPCPAEVQNMLTPELVPVIPQNPEERPVKEILEFSPRPIMHSHVSYRNLIFVYPRSVNFTNRLGVSARNIACRVQMMCGEDEICNALPLIFGKSSCPQMSTEALTCVTYHNKVPDFNDEIKMKLPARLTDRHHLLFTFYHISCQQRKDGTLGAGGVSGGPTSLGPTETPIGYSWLPLCPADSSTSPFGDHTLPIMIEKPPPSYSFLHANVAIPNTKWLDNHKPLFDVSIRSVSTVFPQDSHLEHFVQLCNHLESGTLVASRLISGADTCEREVRNLILEVAKASAESLINFLPIVLDHLIKLLVTPPLVFGHTIDASGTVFEALCSVVSTIAQALDDENDQHRRSPQLASYIQYQCTLPHPPADVKPGNTRPTPPSGSAMDLENDEEICGILERTRLASPTHGSATVPTQPPTSGVRTDCGFDQRSRKLVHEEVVKYWINNRSSTENPLMNQNYPTTWFFFELIIKSMQQHLATTGKLQAPRKQRFSDRFQEEIMALVNSLTDEIIAKSSPDNAAVYLNAHLAFFVHDLFSIMDRGFVFQLIKLYFKYFSSKMYIGPDMVNHQLFSLRLDFLRIVCSHEHYIPLNLPLAPQSLSSPPVSPSPSVNSSSSQSSVAQPTELSHEFRQTHFLAGLVLSQLTTAFAMENSQLRYKAVCLVLNLLSWHDWDARYAEPEKRARIVTLYLPLLSIVVDNAVMLFDFTSTLDHPNQPSRSTLEVIAGSRVTKVRDEHLREDTSRHLLLCFLWLLRNADRRTLKHSLAEWRPVKLQRFVAILRKCASCFQYKGRQSIHGKVSRGHVTRRSSDLNRLNRLEEAILGQGSARSELIRRKLQLTSSLGSSQPGSAGALVSTGQPTQSQPEQLRSRYSSTQCRICYPLVSSSCCIFFHAINLPPSSRKRSLATRFPELLFDEESAEHCSELCLLLLRHCSSRVSAIRSQAAASLYLLMRQNFEIGNNFARVKMQVTVSLSSLVGRRTSFSDRCLRISLRTVQLYAEGDADLHETNFPAQVSDLVTNLHTILSDTVKMKECESDPDMLMDLMYRIARGYQDSPDLRLTWLANMSGKHLERHNHSEAAHCHLHAAALVAEYLHIIEHKKYLPVGCAAFEKICWNVLEESAISDDVISPDEDIRSAHFTEHGLVALLELAAKCFWDAQEFESVNHIYKIAIPILEAHRDYKKLEEVHKKLSQGFQLMSTMGDKRHFGTYFRVGFYGPKLNDMHAMEFIYKERSLTKLPEISSRLETLYAKRFGEEFVEIIKDSNAVDVDLLNPEKVYIQITYVEPYFELYEQKDRTTLYERNNKIMRFMYATPFTPSGRAHGDLWEQHKRKTVLTTTHAFPYIKTRVQVVDRQQMVLAPIEVAIEDIERKNRELQNAVTQEPPDVKILQMVLQGSIGAQVNQGPLEVANVFLGELVDSRTVATYHQSRLRLCFKEFIKRIGDCLKKNRQLISADQKDYQKEMEKNYQLFNEKLKPMIQSHAR
ncbi:dedicator of cytokinesis protein 7-like [Tropilaelaps mercedesae]|uniref:Dedicator of cytokinesis protein 7-like n=1 Tax=Tropilaelaps mercedesae TaxID=418985 RepID=A0A1V9XQA7_9ACAR|nr:dedicator of cytokinesis protein 7-like [Tropilaelaps mercedesae]